jgi:hypothetical protein
MATTTHQSFLAHRLPFSLGSLPFFPAVSGDDLVGTEREQVERMNRLVSSVPTLIGQAPAFESFTKKTEWVLRYLLEIQPELLATVQSEVTNLGPYLGMLLAVEMKGDKAQWKLIVDPTLDAGDVSQFFQALDTLSLGMSNVIQSWA